MFQLKVTSPNLEGFSVVLKKSTLQDFAVVCGLWPAAEGLPTTVLIDDAKQYFYASNFQGTFQDCLTISADLISSFSLVQGNIYEFNGTSFVQKGQTPPDFAYGLRNGGSSPITCGLCQEITVNGVSAKPIVCVQSLPLNMTQYFQTNDVFWLGVGQLTGLKDPQPGILLSKSILSVNKSLQPCMPMLGRFTPVDFSESASWVATFDGSSNTFQLQPG